MPFSRNDGKEMKKNSSPTARCHVCGKSFPSRSMRAWSSIRPSVSKIIEGANPGWGEGEFICQSDLAQARRDHVAALLEEERGELGKLDHQIIKALASQQFVTQNTSQNVEEKLTFGDRIADKFATFGGSWTFIISFLIVLLVWMGVNASQFLQQPFDPYPFILLNLVLSSIAALQAPVIMMSQRRQEEKDRLRADNDYLVNLKAELEIRQLHEKIDHQLAHQWEKLTELQQIQIDMLEDGSDVRNGR
jgi:uncharacterized membrane protein